MTGLELLRKARRPRPDVPHSDDAETKRKVLECLPEPQSPTPLKADEQLAAHHLVQPEFSVDRPEIRWLDQPAVRHAHGMQGAF
jgi:hypothetical protein